MPQKSQMHYWYQINWKRQSQKEIYEQNIRYIYIILSQQPCAVNKSQIQQRLEVTKRTECFRSIATQILRVSM